MDVILEADRQVQTLPCGHRLHAVCANEWRNTANIVNLFHCPMGCHRSTPAAPAPLQGPAANDDDGAAAAMAPPAAAAGPPAEWEEMPVDDL